MTLRQVRVSARILYWPRCCACCCGVATGTRAATATRTTGKRVIKTQGKYWPIPYCDQCLEHHVVYDEFLQKAKGDSWGCLSILLFLLFGVAFFVSAMAFLLYINGLGRASLPVFLLASAFVVVLFLSFYFARQAESNYAKAVLQEQEDEVRDHMTPTCTSACEAVCYDGWDGSIHTFRFANQAYAAMFESANRKKIIG